jgi:8-oxo-dGTP pyrophosphatase MutT (NUDIX family)
VALVLAGAGAGLVLLLIERAADTRDPWSGNLAFPGGRIEPGETPCRAAVRETREELGLDLEPARPVGRLPDIVGAHLPVRVSCFVFGFERVPEGINANHEVQRIDWVPLARLADPARHRETRVSFGGRELTVPAIHLLGEGRPVLWGITYRLTMQFLDLAGLTPG